MKPMKALFHTPKQRRRIAALDAPFPTESRDFLEAEMAHWRWLSNDERARLERLIQGFLFDKRFEWSNGLERSVEIETIVAASACLLILGLDKAYFRDVSSIIMYPSSVVIKGRRGSPDARGLETTAIVPILGEAALHGPVILAWDSAKRSATSPDTGHNVIYHEFAHKIDMADGVSDGAPPMNQDERARWVDVCTREYELLRSGEKQHPFLDPYAAVNPGEFLAVATEFFFDRPVEMAHHKPDLYGVLEEFYRQDPATRERTYKHRKQADR
jgi:Mlc titration factor MtfA (ptsG expression regulator)